MTWLPPRKPDPSAILTEAEGDAKARRYREALAKHLWFHRHALKHRSSLAGVRLSFALHSWLKLGAKYRPALTALRAARDEAKARLRARRGTWHDFHDLKALNSYLGEERATAHLFTWLDQNRPSMAKQCYPVAQSALIRTRQYRLCGKYIDTDESLGSILRLYRLHKKMAKRPERYGSDLLDYAERTFSNQTTTLAALLTRNGRGAEADHVIFAVTKVKPGRRFKSDLNAARKGKVPAQWP
jgi:hypothetical protein